MKVKRGDAMIVIFLRGVLLYLLLTVMFRFMGKRQVGELEVSDLVTTLLLSEIAALPIDDPDIPLTFALVPILLIMCLEVIFTFLEVRWNPLKKLFLGKPIMLVSKGEIQIEALKKMRITVNELISECRLQGVGNLSDVNYAILEPNGKLSVFPKIENSPVTPAFLEKKQEDSGILHLMILDGVVEKETLKKLGISKEALQKMCKKEKGEMGEMLVFGMDDTGKVLAIKKPKEKK